MFTNRISYPAAASAYERTGDLFVQILDMKVDGVMFRPFERNVRFREWKDRASVCGSARKSLWLEYPYRENPHRHPCHNHENFFCGDPEYYFVVTDGLREFGQDPRPAVHALFVPAETCGKRVLRHLRDIFGRGSILQGTFLDDNVEDFSLLPAALPKAA